MSNSPHFRWLVLFITCLGMLAYSYCYDNVVALQDELQTQYHLSNIQYNLLYSVYAFPNCFLPFVGGVVLDKVGIDIVVVSYFVLIVIGHGLFIFGCIISYYPVMIVGRFLFGAGCEGYAMAIAPLIFEYFKGKELSMALGLTLSLSRVGSSINDVTTYKLYQMTNSIIFAYSVGFALVVLCLLLLLTFSCYRVKFIKSASQKQLSSSSNSSKKSKAKQHDQPLLRGEAKEPEFASYASLGYVPSNDPANDSLMSLTGQTVDVNTSQKQTADFRGDDKEKNEQHKSIDVDVEEEDEEEESNDFRLSDIKHFDRVYWLLVINCGLIYSGITPFMNIAGDFMHKTFAIGHDASHQLLMIPYICGAVFTPLLGYISDQIGKRTQLLFMSTMCLIVSHYILGWSHNAPLYEVIIALCGLGIAFSLFCAVIWPAFAVIVKPHYLGTAYGIPTSFYNAMVSVSYVLVGVFTKKSNGTDKYRNVEYFLMGLSLVSVVTTSLLLMMDKQTGRRLEKPTMVKN